jgi:hypothetical protein
MSSPSVSRRVQSVLGCRTCRVVASELLAGCAACTRPLAARLGDRRWQALLGQHHRLVRAAGPVARAGDPHRRGRVLRHLRRPGPPSAAPWASAGVHALGLSVRAGLHTGEVESSRQRRSAGSPLYRYSQVSHPPW